MDAEQRLSLGDSLSSGSIAPSDPDKPLAAEGYKVMAAAFEVHQTVGGGLLEEVYQECLELEFTEQGVPFVPKRELPVFYKGRQLRKRYIPDFAAYDDIVVEIKALQQLIPDHEAQLLNYMRIARKPVGYLINFGPIKKVEWKRFVLSGFIKKTAGRS